MIDIKTKIFSNSMSIRRKNNATGGSLTVWKNTPWYGVDFKLLLEEPDLQVDPADSDMRYLLWPEMTGSAQAVA
jgi:hypothetical protein